MVVGLFVPLLENLSGLANHLVGLQSSGLYPLFLCPIFTGLAFLCSNVYLPCPCPFLGLAAARRLCGRHRGPAPPLPREREAATDRRAKVEAGQSAYNGDEIAKLQHVRFQVEQDKLFIQRNLARLRNTFVELVKR